MAALIDIAFNEDSTPNLLESRNSWDIDIPLDDPLPERFPQHKAVKRLLLLLTSLAVTFLIGSAAGKAAAGNTAQEVGEDVTMEQPSTVINTEKPAVEPAQTELEAAPEPNRHRDDIVSGGRLLIYELQDIMQECCERYNVPYALALAIADVESCFDLDAESSTSDYGLMQINKINFEWLQDTGIDPSTPAGNIEAGVYIIAQHLQAYGDPDLALMVYNNGASGVKKLWEAGIYGTPYSRKVMAAYSKWTSILST